MVKRVPGKTWKHGGKGSMNELEPPEIQTILETILSVELSEKFCGFPPSSALSNPLPDPPTDQI